MLKLRNGFLSIILLTTSMHLSLAQNLVPNPGFEDYDNCPGGHSEAPHEFSVHHWQSANMGTPDYFNTCSVGEADVPHNWAGVSNAFEGNGYAGIFAWMAIDLPYREYLTCQLTEPLLKDSLYTLRFRYKLSSYSMYSIDRIGLYLSDHPIKVRHDKPLQLMPTLSVMRDSALTRTTGLWETAEMEYKAMGGEAYLVIGNFDDNESTRFYPIKFRAIAQEMLANSAYYYIDDVAVLAHYLLKKEQSILPEFVLTNTKLNTTYVLKNIQFGFNSYKLVPPSFYDLDRVAEYLLKHPKVMVQLSGHTDDRGNDDYNQRLSLNRAKSAGRYLETMGIDAKRIEIFGYGKSKPLVNESTEEARAVNRRVEVRFIQ